MIRNRAGDAGTRKRLGVTKTLAAALVLSLAGVSAAHACNGYVTTVNHRDTEVKVQKWQTQKLGGYWHQDNLSNTPVLGPHSSIRTKIVTTRNKNTDFRLIAQVRGETQEHYSNYATCSDGWTLHVY